MIAAVILAAGSGFRFGSTKQLAELEGKPLLQHVIETAASSMVDEIVVVLGADADRVELSLDLPARARVVRNERHLEGQSTSLAAGLGALREDCKAAVILLGDQPTVAPTAVDAVVDAFHAGAGPIVRARYRGAPAHPVLLDRAVWSDAARGHGDAGARDLLARRPDHVHEVDLDLDPPPDVDTTADLASVRDGGRADGSSLGRHPHSPAGRGAAAMSEQPSWASTAGDPVTCPSCGAANPAGFRFCGSCAAPLERVCPACGTANPPGFRFCGNCAAALDTTPTAAAEAEAAELEERKVVTVLFADLTRSTELARSLDPEDLRGLLQEYFGAMVEEIDRFEGTVQKFIGDAVVAVFGVPAAHEDDPERAVRAALAMHRQLAALNQRLRADRDLELEMRIGVNTGEVVTATGIDRDGLVTGEPVNLAARLEALAEPGTVVVGERTHRDTRHAFAFQPLGGVALKGFDEPVQAWVVQGELQQAAPDAPAAHAAPMVGRASELDLLRLMLTRTVRERRPGLVTVAGPAGIGKSRLAHAFLALARGADPPATVVRGRCLPYGEGLTYWPLAEILKGDIGVMDSDPPASILEKAAARIAERAGAEDPVTTTRVVLSSIGVPVRPDPLAGAEPEVARELIARCWRAYFESLASSAPVVALIEDLHWADPGLLDLLEHLAARVAAPVLFLGMTRPDLWERRPTWGAGLRNATTAELHPLSESESEELVRHLLGDARAPAEALEPVLRRAEGNPFFAQELLRMLIEEGYLVRDEHDWRLDRALPAALPDTVQGVIASRIDGLRPEEKRAIQDASVVGRVFWEGALEYLGSGGARVAVDGLLDKGLAWEREASTIEGERELTFNHVLTRDVAYQGIPRRRRAEAHARALEWVERVTGGRAEEFAEILAHHAEQAGDDARTARYAMLAGHRTRRVFAAEEAIRWYDRALGAAARLDPGERHGLEPEVHLSRGEALEQLGRFAEAEADYRSAAETAAGAVQARALGALAHVLWLLDRYEDGERILHQALERSRVVGDGSLESRLLYTLGTTRFGQGRYRESLDHHEEALRVARAAGDLEGEAWARHGLCESRYFLGPYERALEEGREADRLLRQLGQRPMVYHNGYMIGFVLWNLGRQDEAEPVALDALHGAQEVGDRRNEAFASIGTHLLALSRGDLGEAFAEVDRALEIAREIGARRLELAGRAFRAMVALQLGDRGPELGPEVEEVDLGYQAIGSDFSRGRVVALRGWVDLDTGREGQARAHFAAARALAEGVPTEGLFVHQIEMLAWDRARRPEELDAAAWRLCRVAEGQAPGFGAWGRYGRARAAALRGNWDLVAGLAPDAPELAHEAILRWRIHSLLATALERLGDANAAEAHRSQSRAVAQRLQEGLPEQLRADLSAPFEATAGEDPIPGSG